MLRRCVENNCARKGFSGKPFQEGISNEGLFMADELEKLREKARQAMTPPTATLDAPPTDPSPSIPASTTQATTGATKKPVGLPAIPRNKACRVIRVKTEEGVIAMINADDYDPEMKGHLALTPEDEKWGKMAVEARNRADYEAEKVAAIKRVVRGG
jgi:hypothetical protein